MIFSKFQKLFILPLLLSAGLAAQTVSFPIVTKDATVTIIYDPSAPLLDSIAANLLADDINKISSVKPIVLTDLSKAKGNVIVIGALHSPIIKKFITTQSALYKKLQGKWECFGLKVFQNPLPAISKALVIAGSDVRGTAYGVFTLSEKLGVSPWYWWADVAVNQQKELIINQEEFTSHTPSIKYRGIFINDEDWGLRPWAANTFEPAKKNIGPKTYAKVFELLLRLKANLLWPAMHPGTAPFYSDPENTRTAEAYGIVIGSSHAEPMLRNNVGEWDEKTMGHFNYLTNKQTVFQYWKDRVIQTKKNDVVYTLGMRGVHDSGLEGIKSAKEAVPLLEQIIKDQRRLLKEQLQKNPVTIPQVFTVYKEVLDIYDNGLKLPDDVTIVWPDDNYGYIQRLNNEAEKKRAGGSGVYYHASYWGRPHDYLWLSTTHPSLIRGEMMKAYETGADRLWVLNVGDIKPLEYNMQLFFDMAYNATPFLESSFPKRHLSAWTQSLFGIKEGLEAADILWRYYDLAFERRPEFMGWSQTEPTTRTNLTAYNHFYYGDEAQHRIDKYNLLQQSVVNLRRQIKSKQADAFYQLVYYPVSGAALMNKKFLYRDKAFVYAKQNRIIANDYANLSATAYDSLVNETTYFNRQLSNGKWQGIMSLKPRELPVFNVPDFPTFSFQNNVGWDVIPEGFDTTDYISKQEKKLPDFLSGIKQTYFIDIFLTDTAKVSWSAEASVDWLRFSKQSGILSMTQPTQRIWVSAEWKEITESAKMTAFIIVSAAGRKTEVKIQAVRPAFDSYATFTGFVETNGYISMLAQHYNSNKSSATSKWRKAAHLTAFADSSLISVNSRPISFDADTTVIRKDAASVSYDFFSFSNVAANVNVYTLPTHPLHKSFSMRYGCSIDDGPIRIIDFKTVGRSEEWKQNVLRNSAIRSLTLPSLKPGIHTLKFYVIDPGVVLDRIVIHFNNKQYGYSVIPETRKE